MERKKEDLNEDIELSVVLPNTSIVTFTVKKRLPLMDLLVLVSSKHHIKPSEHTIQAVSENTTLLRSTPNTPVYALKARYFQIVRKHVMEEQPPTPPIAPPRRNALPNISSTLPPKHKPDVKSVDPQKLLLSYRLLVHLPNNQLHVMRVTPDMTIKDVLAIVQDAKNLNINNFYVHNKNNFNIELDFNNTLAHYQIKELVLERKNIQVPLVQSRTPLEQTAEPSTSGFKNGIKTFFTNLKLSSGKTKRKLSLREVHIQQPTVQKKVQNVFYKEPTFTPQEVNSTVITPINKPKPPPRKKHAPPPPVQQVKVTEIINSQTHDKPEVTNGGILKDDFPVLSSQLKDSTERRVEQNTYSNDCRKKQLVRQLALVTPSSSVESAKEENPKIILNETSLSKSTTEESRDSDNMDNSKFMLETVPPIVFQSEILKHTNSEEFIPPDVKYKDEHNIISIDRCIDTEPDTSSEKELHIEKQSNNERLPSISKNEIENVDTSEGVPKQQNSLSLDPNGISESAKEKYESSSRKNVEDNEDTKSEEKSNFFSDNRKENIIEKRQSFLDLSVDQASVRDDFKNQYIKNINIDKSCEGGETQNAKLTNTDKTLQNVAILKEKLKNESVQNIDKLNSNQISHGSQGDKMLHNDVRARGFVEYVESRNEDTNFNRKDESGNKKANLNKKDYLQNEKENVIKKETSRNGNANIDQKDELQNGSENLIKTNSFRNEIASAHKKNELQKKNPNFKDKDLEKDATNLNKLDELWNEYLEKAEKLSSDKSHYINKVKFVESPCHYKSIYKNTPSTASLTNLSINNSKTQHSTTIITNDLNLNAVKQRNNLINQDNSITDKIPLTKTSSELNISTKSKHTPLFLLTSWSSDKVPKVVRIADDTTHGSSAYSQTPSPSTPSTDFVEGQIKEEKILEEPMQTNTNKPLSRPVVVSVIRKEPNNSGNNTNNQNGNVKIMHPEMPVQLSKEMRNASKSTSPCPSKAISTPPKIQSWELVNAIEKMFKKNSNDTEGSSRNSETVQSGNEENKYFNKLPLNFFNYISQTGKPSYFQIIAQSETIRNRIPLELSEQSNRSSNESLPLINDNGNGSHSNKKE